MTYLLRALEELDARPRWCSASPSFLLRKALLAADHAPHQVFEPGVVQALGLLAGAANTPECKSQAILVDNPP